jgi:hypothetical protein
VVVHAEVSGTGIQKQGSKMCRIGMNGEVMARAGSMVAYQGDLKFEAQGSGGIGRAIRQTLSGEGVPLMKVIGRGDLFLADAASDVHLIDLDGSDGERDEVGGVHQDRPRERWPRAICPSWALKGMKLVVGPFWNERVPGGLHQDRSRGW